MTFAEAEQKVKNVKDTVVGTRYKMGSIHKLAKVLTVIPAPVNCDMFMYLTDYWNIDKDILFNKYPDNKFDFRAVFIIAILENGREIMDYYIGPK